MKIPFKGICASDLSIIFPYSYYGCNLLLANRFGLEASVVLLYFFNKIPSQGRVVDNRRWYKKTYAELETTFPFISRFALKKAVTQLLKDGILDCAQFQNAHGRQPYYSISKPALHELLRESCDQFEATAFLPIEPESDKEDYYGGTRGPAMELALLMHRSVQKAHKRSHSIKMADMNAWSNQFERIKVNFRLDYDRIEQVMLWTFRDDFWSARITGPMQLSRNFVTLESQMEKDLKEQAPIARNNKGETPRELSKDKHSIKEVSTNDQLKHYNNRAKK